jgi:hypothetical protein
MDKGKQRVVDNALLAQLKNPFPVDKVKFRVGATSADKSMAIALAYIDSRDVQKRLDEVVGISNWRSRMERFEGGFICTIDIKINGEWVSRSDAAGDTHVEPIKGGASDALKRAAAQWGVGRYLYYLPNQWVRTKKIGRTVVLAEKPKLPQWAMPQANLDKWLDKLDEMADSTSGADDYLSSSSIVNSIDKTVKEAMDREKDNLIKKLKEELGNESN